MKMAGFLLIFTCSTSSNDASYKNLPGHTSSNDRRSSLRVRVAGIFALDLATSLSPAFAARFMARACRALVDAPAQSTKFTFSKFSPLRLASEESSLINVDELFPASTGFLDLF